MDPESMDPERMEPESMGPESVGPERDDAAGSPAASRRELARATDGIRTRDVLDHNQVLYP